MDNDYLADSNGVLNSLGNIGFCSARPMRGSFPTGGPLAVATLESRKAVVARLPDPRDAAVDGRLSKAKEVIED